MSRALVVLALVLGFVAPHGATAAKPAGGSHLLDGKTFYGKETRGEGSTPRGAVYVFKDGTFEAQWWQAVGLQPGPYTVTVEGETIHFQADCRGRREDMGSAHWEGTVAGPNLQVKGVVQKPGRPALEVSGTATLSSGGPPPKMLLDAPPPVSDVAIPEPGSRTYDRWVQGRRYQTETLETMRKIGAALVAWQAKQPDVVPLPLPKLGTDSFPVPPPPPPPPSDVAFLQDLPQIPLAQAQDLLVPAFLPALDATDGWCNPIDIRINLDAPKGAHAFCLRSAGADGRVSGMSYKKGAAFSPFDLDQDLVWCDGALIRQPGEVPPPKSPEPKSEP